MKQELELAKETMKHSSRPYKAYGYYLSIPIAYMIVYILAFFNVSQTNFGTILLVFTILANIDVRKLELISKRKYVAPILIYILNAIGIIFFIPIMIEMFNGGTGDIFLGLLGLISLPIQITAIIFFFITANDIKKAYPDMKQLAKESREKYLQLKRESKQKN